MAAAAGLAGAAYAGVVALAVVVFVLQLALACGWARVVTPRAQGHVGREARRGGTLSGARGRVRYVPLGPAGIGVAAAATADAILIARLAPGSLVSPLLGMGAAQRALALLLACTVPAAFGQQLARGGNGTDTPAPTSASTTPVTAPASGAVTGAVLTVLTAHWIPAGAKGSGAATAALAMLCAGALITLVVHTLALRPAAAAAAILLCAAPVGGGIGFLSPLFGAAHGAVLGVAAGLFVSPGFAASSYVRARWGGSAVLAAALPLATVAPAAYFLGRMIPG